MTGVDFTPSTFRDPSVSWEMRELFSVIASEAEDPEIKTFKDLGECIVFVHEFEHDHTLTPGTDEDQIPEFVEKGKILTLIPTDITSSVDFSFRSESQPPITTSSSIFYLDIRNDGAMQGGVFTNERKTLRDDPVVIVRELFGEKIVEASVDPRVK